MKLLGISGSLRAASLNTALVRHAAATFAPDEFVMGDLTLPLYSGDTEAEGIPASVQTLANQISDADAVIIATPEYNKALSGVLKNALDWVSRVDGNPWAGKPVAILSCTAGRTGGERAQASLRECLQPFQPRLLMGPDVLIASNYQTFEDGALTDERGQAAVERQMAALRAAAS